CAPTHPLANEPAPQRADRLQPHTQVVLSERATRTEDIGVISPRTWRVTHLGLKIELLLAGVGWGSAPLTMITEHLERGELVRLEPAPWADGRHDVQLHTVVRADRPLGPAGSWLRQRFSAQD
nr:LysR family transcriptional regulator [Gammaproteobacteria bacterium]